MQGKEQKLPHERGEEQKEQRWNEERDRPPLPDDKLVSGQDQPAGTGKPPDEEKVDKDGDEKVALTVEEKEKLHDKKDPSGDAVEWERNQEQAILDQWGLHPPATPASQESLDQIEDETKVLQTETKETDSRGDQNESTQDREMKQKPVGELIWKKSAAKDEHDPHTEMPADPLPPEEKKENKSDPVEEETDVPTYVPHPSDSSPPAPETEMGEVDSSKRRIPTVWKVLSFLFLGLPLLAVIALLGGLLIGYSVVGDDPAGDVFSRDLWKHLYNMIYG